LESLILIKALSAALGLFTIAHFGSGSVRNSNLPLVAADTSDTAPSLVSFLTDSAHPNFGTIDSGETNLLCAKVGAGIYVPCFQQGRIGFLANWDSSDLKYYISQFGTNWTRLLGMKILLKLPVCSKLTCNPFGLVTSYKYA
jgi:hypothetical protein